MSRSALVGNVTAMLRDAGFLVSDRCAIRPKSFDVAARRGNDVLLLKILGNIDAFDAKTGAEMRRLGEYLHATALVIGLRTRDEELDPGVVYFRHGVPPLIYAAPGGLYVNIDSEVLADAREDRDWSLGQLAQELGVSRRTVSKYEDGMDASVEVAAQLEEMFDEDLQQERVIAAPCGHVEALRPDRTALADDEAGVLEHGRDVADQCGPGHDCSWTDISRSSYLYVVGDVSATYSDFRIVSEL